MAHPSHNAPLTEWEKHERDGLLALETEEWREKRLIAKNLNTSSVVLARLADEIIATWTKDAIGTKLQGHLLVGAIAAHPETPPQTLIKLLILWTYFGELSKPNRYGFRPAHEWVVCWGELSEMAVAHTPRGICRNPKMFHFWKRVDSLEYFMVLREGNLPSQIVAQLAHCKLGKLYDSAHLHVSLAGEIQTQNDGIRFLTQYGPQIYEKGKTWESTTLDPLGPNDFYHEGQSYHWLERAYAALKLPASEIPFSFDRWNRSPLDLLNHLARDGNRLVRWIAGTRLANPDFNFNWQGGETT